MKNTVTIIISVFIAILVLIPDLLQAQSVWEKTGSPQTGLQTHHILATDNALIAGTYAGLHISYNSGQSWIQEKDMRYAHTGSNPFTALAANENYLFTLDNHFLKRFAFPLEESTSKNITLPKSSSGNTLQITDLVTMEELLFMATNEGVFKSTNAGTSWLQTAEFDEDNGQAQLTNTLLAAEDTLFAGTYKGFYRTEDKGDTWEPVNPDNTAEFTDVQYLSYYNGQLFIASMLSTDAALHFYRSDDFGRSWTEIGENLLSNASNLFSFTILDDNYFAITQAGLMKSTDFGENWSLITAGMGENDADFNTLIAESGYLYAGTDAGLYRSHDNAVSWEQLAVKRYLSVSALAEDADNDMLYAEAEGGIYRSADMGENWVEFYIPSDSNTVSIVPSLKIWDDYLLAGSENGLYRTETNNETAQWEKVLEDSTGSAHIRLFTIWQDTLYAKAGKRLYQSSDYGSSWTLLSEDLMNSGYSDRYGLLEGYDDYFYSANESGFLRSADNGRTWENTGKLATGVVLINDIIKSDGLLFAATDGRGILASNDNGSSWIGSDYGIPGSSKFISAMAKYNDVLYADLYVSANNGQSWEAVQNGIETEANRGVLSLQIHRNVLFAGTAELGIIKRPLNEEAVSVTEEDETASAFVLHQNYPNPFNPSTNITFSIKEKAAVSLKIYDITGREIAVLVSENMPAGTYTRIWNAGRFASGVYFYKLTAGSFTQTRKLTLIK